MAVWDSTLATFSPRIWLKMDQNLLDTSNNYGSIQSWTIPPSMQYFNTSPTVNTTGGATGHWINLPTGGSNYVEMQPFINYIPEITNKSFTIGTWFKRSGVPVGNSEFVIGTWGQGQAFLGFIIPGTNDAYGNGGRLIWNFNGTTTGTGNGSPGLVTDGNWHFAAMTVSGGDVKYYLDGALIGQQYGLDLGTTNIQRIFIGSSGNYSNALHGGIDDFFLTNTVLTQTDISTLYGATADLALLKHWTGSAWAAPIAIKRFYNGSWQNIGTELKTWTGSAWKVISK